MSIHVTHLVNGPIGAGLRIQRCTACSSISRMR